jgi:uncharacterized protein DUF6480
VHSAAMAMKRNDGTTVPPGETPQGEDSMSGAGPDETRHNPTRGWAAAPLIVIVLTCAVFVGFFLAYAVLLAL